MNFDKIEKWSFRYALLKLYLSFIHNFVWYRKIEFKNIENLPENEAVIITPNHQNALMDALAILFAVKGQPVFLARSDIFANPWSARFLKFIKIMPIYRIRDGMESLGKNDAVFDKTLEILSKKQKLVILPEGNHAGFRRLRALKKGVSRIAFKAEEDNDFKLGIKIVPVGIDYSHYQNFRTRLLINFGKPIPVSDFIDLYKENPQKGMNALRMKLKKEISPLMLDIQSNENYDLFYDVSEMAQEENKAKLYERLLSRKKIIQKLSYLEQNNPENIEKLKNHFDKYSQILKKYNLKHWVIKKRKLSAFNLFIKTFGYLVGFPFFLFGLLTNYIPYIIPMIVTKNVKDPQFHSSFKFVLGVISFTVFYIIAFFTFFAFFEIWWIRLLFIILVPSTGIFSIHYYIGLKKLKSLYKLKSIQKSEDYQEIINNRNKILEILNN
jgi:1-acyl-sn-glycerol-3-phosphate acyltransferase